MGYAQHLLMLATKLNAAQADAVNPAMLCDRFIDGLHLSSLCRDIRRYTREHAEVTFHQARAEAQCWMPRMLMWRCERSRSCGSTSAQQGSGGAAGPSSGSDEEDNRAAG